MLRLAEMDDADFGEGFYGMRIDQHSRLNTRAESLPAIAHVSIDDGLGHL
jgi:hypothetical protein